MHHNGRVVSRTELVEHLYDQDFDRDSNTIEVFVGRLRKKIPVDVIQTVRGLGYRMSHECPMRLNSLAFRLFATSAAWTLLVLPLAGYLIYSLYRDDVQLSFDAQLKKLLTALSIDSMNTTGDVPVAPQNLYEPLFEVTHSGWYWQIRPIDGVPGRTLVSPSLASEVAAIPLRQEISDRHDRHALDERAGADWRNHPHSRSHRYARA